MIVSLVYARSVNCVIGDNNGLPWNLKEDLQRFKRLTQGHSVIMGRQTYESIGRPLKARQNIVLTRNKELDLHQKDDYYSCVVHDKDAALDSVRNDLVFVIGGEQIYKMFYDDCSNFYETIIWKHFDGDTKFAVDCKGLMLHNTEINYSADCCLYYQFNHWIKRG
jgi:dihydrofolate reductase